MGLKECIERPGRGGGPKKSDFFEAEEFDAREKLRDVHAGTPHHKFEIEILCKECERNKLQLGE